MGHIPPSCHSSDATDMSHKGSQNQRRHTGSAAFPRGLPNNECLHETAMTGMSWNACDLKIMNSNLKKLCEHTATLTWVTDGWILLSFMDSKVFSVYSRAFTFEGGVSLTGMNVFVLCGRKNIHSFDLINPSERFLGTAWLFHCMVPNPRGPGCHMVPYESAHCDDNVTGLPDPAFCCCTAICVFSVIFVSKTEWERYKVWWNSGCLGQDPSVPALCPTETSAPDRARPGKVQQDMVSWHTRAWMAKCRML